MDLSTLKNMDVKDLLEKLKGLKGLKGQAIFSDKKILSKFAIIFGSIIIFLFTYHFWISPKIFQPQKNKLAEMNMMKTETDRMTEGRADLLSQIKALEPEFNEKTSLFHTNAEFENFMMTMDDLAKKYGLSVDEIIRGDRSPVYNQNTNDQNTNTENSMPPLYYSLPVTWKISGTYLGYLKYRWEISRTKKHVHFHKETISVQENARPGEILAQGKISIVQLPD